ncbi:MAG: Crp/Fnr family transcriptional regulator [Clostridia bacterium]
MGTFQTYFPVWGNLTANQQRMLLDGVTVRSAQKGMVLHNGAADCVGLFLLKSGQLRAYILSDEGKEVSLYRLFERDMCLFSGSCIMSSIQFDIAIEAEKDTSLWVIPAAVYKRLMNESAAVANYTNQLMAARFSDVMWLMDQVLFKNVDERLAAFLLSERNIEQSDKLLITHEKVAQHLGTAREVVTRMLKYFQSEGMVTLSRGGIVIADSGKLGALVK